MTHFEHMNRAQMRRDLWRDRAERALAILTVVVTLTTAVVVSRIIIDLIDTLNRSW